MIVTILVGFENEYKYNKVSLHKLNVKFHW